MKQKILERLGYSNRIERMFGRGMMIALTGQRRVGKSCVMRRIYNHIAENEENHVIYIDKEKTSFDMIANYQDLEAYVAANIVEGKENYLFIDEVQEISDFEKALLSIQSDDTCQIMITGSNAKMLSGELATRLRGRYIAYRIRGLYSPGCAVRIVFYEIPDALSQRLRLNASSLECFLHLCIHSTLPMIPET
jgi:predicted AAA+ superfamily ATPase